MLTDLSTVLIAVTYECPCRCLHCGAALSRHSDRKELSTQEIEGLLEQCSLCKVDAASFFGGEPLCRADLVHLVRYAAERGMMTNIDSNAYLLTESRVKALHEAGLHVMGISIDSPDAEEHDRLRGIEGLFAKAVQGIQACLDRGLFCYISTYVTHETLANGDLERTIEMGRRLGVSWVRVCPPYQTGKWMHSSHVRLRPEERSQLEALASTDPEFILLEDFGHCPGMQKRLVYVSAYGDIQPCCYVPIPFGNIRTEPFVRLVEKMFGDDMFVKYGNLAGCPMNHEGFRREYIDADHPE